uniref:Virion structural protein n=1 Tax=Pseudomonas phage HRDY3 TaxID=3236930 RepID=A0AB39CDW1_9VIRU
MQIQSKYIDDNPNIIDLKNARNANEVVTVLTRINTATGVLVSKFNQKKLPFLKVSDGVEALTFCVDSLVELRCARSVAQEFSDSKRDRCFQMISALQSNIRSFQKTLLDLIDGVCSSRMDKHLDYLSDIVYKILSRISHTTQLHLRLPEYQMICFRTDSGIQDKNGYVSGPITVKLTLLGGVYRISIPDSPYVLSGETIVESAKDVQTYITGNLSDFEYVGKPVPKDDKLLASKLVKNIEVTDDTLNVVLKPFVKPEDINKFLMRVLPYLKRAVSLPDTDVIHRVSQYGNNFMISFIVGKRKIYDVQSLNKLTKLLNVGKSEKDKLNTIMEQS